MPPEEAGYTYAVEPTAIDRLLANEEESIYRPSESDYERQLPTQRRPSSYAPHHRPMVRLAITAGEVAFNPFG